MVFNKSVLTPLAIALLLGACSGGSDQYGLGNGGGNDAGGTNTDQTDDTNTDQGNTDAGTEVSLALGTGTGVSFTSGAIADTLGGTDLSFGGDATFTVNVVNTSDNSLYTDETVTVSFTSTCVGSGDATIETSKSTGTGIATVTYSADTCKDSDIITATLPDGTSATTNITIADQQFGSLAFISATPETIALKGNGSASRPEFSNVIFQLLDDQGNPISSEEVTYSLSTTVGEIDLSPGFTSLTGADGTTSVSLNAGSVPVSVSVTASYTDPLTATTFSTVSNPIAIGGGIPDQNSFSLSVDIFNPRGLNFDGTTSTLTIRAADRYNNPAPDGTQVSFLTTGGSIESSCAISAGACSVTWTSQNPRPADGLVHILARTSGEESFTDLDSNGVFDVTDTVLTHLDEAILDDDYDGWESGEFFSDFNEDGSFTAKPNLLFQGTGCSAAAITAGHCANFVDVRETATLCMSSDAVLLSDNVGSSLDVSGGAATVTFTLTDINGLIPANGTTVSVTAEDSKILVGDTVVIPNACWVNTATNTPIPFTFSVQVVGDGATADANPATTGLLTVEVTQANGVVLQYPVTVTD